MPRVRSVSAWFFVNGVGTLVAAATLSGSAVAQIVQDPGVRGGPPGPAARSLIWSPAGDPNPANRAFSAQVFFTSVFSVTGSINDAPPGLTNGGPGLA
jgi:hypothetical protein